MRKRRAVSSGPGSALPQVAVLVDTSTGWGRGIVQGIVKFSRLHGPWRLRVEPRGQSEWLRPPSGWAGEGVIARVSSRKMAGQLHELGCPVVNVSGIEISGVGWPRVTNDVNVGGELAGRYFLDRGFRHFAYCGWTQFAHVQRHHRAFADVVKTDCPVFSLGTRNTATQGWKRQQTRMVDWLKGLPKPVALLTWALQGLAVLDACTVAELRVPEEVAILCGDNDELLYETTAPPLSGVALPVEQIGFEAAVVLAELMRGRPASIESFYVRPTHVVTRQSTDILAVQDADLAAAIRFIRQRAGSPIRVVDILREVPLSRRSLERKFYQLLRRSPADEIRRVHLDRARQLLCDSDLSIPRVATLSGFGSPEYLSYAFKRAEGLTPLKYRSRVRGRSLGDAARDS
jgi:LacI family transcriptional regulator